MEKTYGVVESPVMFDKHYIQSFIDKALDLGHVPTAEEFDYCEKDNFPTARVENTTLVALSYSLATNTAQHALLLKMCSQYIHDTFELFKKHGAALTIFKNCQK